MSPETRSYIRSRFEGWTLYCSTREWLFHRYLRRYGEARLREIVGATR
jgi:hypothetical protein